MKALLITCMAFVAVAHAESFSEEFQRLSKDGRPEAVVKFLGQAKAKEAGNPDYYALAANYWWTLAQQPNLSAKPADKGESALIDPKTGKAVGSISTSGKLDPEILQKALDFTTEGYRKFPLRLDLGFGLAYGQFQSNQPEAAVVTVKSILKTAQEQADKLLWSENKPLPSPAKDFIPRSIQGYTAPLFNEETKKSDALCKELCEATIATYPDHPYAYNMLAALANANGNKDEALRLLETAHQKAPKDPLILDNLAKTYLSNKQPERAIEAYRKILKLDVGDDTKADVNAAIKELEAPKTP